MSVGMAIGPALCLLSDKTDCKAAFCAFLAVQQDGFLKEFKASHPAQADGVMRKT